MFSERETMIPSCCQPNRVVRTCECQVIEADLQDQIFDLSYQPADWYRSFGSSQYLARNWNDSCHNLHHRLWGGYYGHGLCDRDFQAWSPRGVLCRGRRLHHGWKVWERALRRNVLGEFMHDDSDVDGRYSASWSDLVRFWPSRPP